MDVLEVMEISANSILSLNQPFFRVILKYMHSFGADIFAPTLISHMCHRLQGSTTP